MSTKKISIIMGVYNCESTLKEAIDCIINQTYQNWEFIICDDGSTDKSFEIVKQYADTDKRFVAIQNETNLGLNKTLNKCLKYATGEYIARMDGDDICAANRLEAEVSFLDENPQYAIVSTQMAFFDEKGAYRVTTGGGEPKNSGFARTTQIFHAPCMVRKEAYLSVNGYAERDDRLRVEDWDLWIRMLEKGYRVYNLPDALYSMRDDRNAYKRRKYKYRVNEAKVSVSAVRKLKLSPVYYVFALRPLIIGLLPQWLYMLLHKSAR